MRLLIALTIGELYPVHIFEMLDILGRNSKISESLRIRIGTHLELPAAPTHVSHIIEIDEKTIRIPSGRVTRAETWLTVYRSLYIFSAQKS